MCTVRHPIPPTSPSEVSLCCIFVPQTFQVVRNVQGIVIIPIRAHYPMASADAYDKLFKQAAEWVRNSETLKLSTEQKLKMYGLFKQVQ